MVTAFHFFIAALVTGSVAFRPIFTRDSSLDLASVVDSGNSTTGFDSQQGQDIHGTAADEQQDDQGAAADEQDQADAAAATKASVAEAATSISIAASIATASFSAAAAAATQIVNPLDPFPPDTHSLTREQGQLAGLKAKLAIDT
ncbi:hypothetical protein B0H14DRAFT_3483447 [Mycena olivaceomarginata]|nr:hypothetical protein B0H14DRAFT_3483447 [Mycena olivaceomarginata]